MYYSPKPAVKAHFLLVVLSLLPTLLPSLIPVNFLIVLTASLAVYSGSWRSVKPVPPTESMTKKDAMRFPLVGSAVLFSLFLAFKFLPKAWVNALLTAYIGGIAVVVLAGALAPYFTDFFPDSIRHKSITFPAFKIPRVMESTEPTTITLPQIVFGIISAAFCVWYYINKSPFANNTLGLAFSLEGIEHLSLGSTTVGIILLCGLFLYDIFWVFCTPVMVSVATNFDAPIKLLFPRVVDELGKRPYAMLGLGDIVIPGIFVALMLRMDVSTGFRSNYFQSAFGGYVLGLGSTIVIMNVFNAAQPALLYIVPAVLGCVFLHAAVRGEVKKVLTFDETPAKDGDEEKKDLGDKKKDS
mmetsp:Transcript_18937/g.53063  ORF Transcript_18937/g.53063 Transcript_18937/m.53063 type:complete len:355 (-) Transcript_18937:316-1380(-)